SGLFVYLNANKKSVTLNLKTAAGQAILRELVRWADVAVTGYPPRVLERLGLEHAALAKSNRRLATVAITSFGLTGPYRDYKADHMVLCALGAWAQYVGRQDRPPLQAGLDLALQVGGLQAASAAIGLYRLVQETGRPHQLDLSLMETVTHMLPASALNYLMTGVVVTRGMYPFPSQGILQCDDGYLGVNTLTENHWELMCQWMGMPEVLEDERFAAATGRWEHTDELRRRAEASFAGKGKHELFHEGQAWGVATGLVSTAEDMLSSDQLRDRGYFVGTAHPRLGDVQQPGAPVHMTASPWRMRTPAPSLGQHNAEVYCGLVGLSREELVKLRELRAI
ncbi:MAG: CoA transferase, partial [Dehalococcoidia bacterium]